jgi:hypothetical protein
MNGLPKYVLTHGQLAVEWENSHPVRLDERQFASGALLSRYAVSKGAQA